MKKEKQIILFFGPPGSGKGTQADMLGEYLKMPVISPGELLRHERDAKTKIGKKVEGLIAKGRLVPDEIIEKILDKRLVKRDTGRGFILDGYPRRLSQLKHFKQRLKKIVVENDEVIAIYIDASDKKIKMRISGRRVCDCGASYHIKNNPPKKKGVCDLCGAKLYRRKDDAPDILKGRLERYHKRIKPLMIYFKNNHINLRINGDFNIEQVKKEIIKQYKVINK